MKDEYTNGKKMARNGRNTVVYKGTFISNHSLGKIAGFKFKSHIFLECQTFEIYLLSKAKRIYISVQV